MSYLRHPLDIGSLVLGLIYLGVVTAWGLFELDVVSGDDAAWLLPAVLVTAGVLGIVLAATKQRRDRRPGDVGYEYGAPPAANPIPPWPTADADRPGAPAYGGETDIDTVADTDVDTHTDTQTKERHDD